MVGSGYNINYLWIEGTFDAAGGCSGVRLAGQNSAVRNVTARGAEIQLHQLYRAMDFLEANKDALEREIFFQTSDLLNLDLDVIFYDTTSLHFEIDAEDEGAAEESAYRCRSCRRMKRESRTPDQPP